MTYIRPERDEGFAWRVYAPEGDPCGHPPAARLHPGWAEVPAPGRGLRVYTRVARVVGTTSEGARATAVPVNGFWFMEVSAKRPDVTWRSINALNRWGLLVHKYSPNLRDVPPGCPT